MSETGNIDVTVTDKDGNVISEDNACACGCGCGDAEKEEAEAETEPDACECGGCGTDGNGATEPEDAKSCECESAGEEPEDKAEDEPADVPEDGAEDKPADAAKGDDLLKQVGDVAHGTIENLGKAAAVFKESAATAYSKAASDADTAAMKEQAKEIGDGIVKLGKNGLGIVKGFAGAFTDAYKRNSEKIKEAEDK